MANQSASAHIGPDVSRAAAIAAEYDALQGYAWMTLGGGLVLAGVTGMEAVYIALGGAFAGMVPSWYHRRYGLARPTGRRSANITIGTVVALVLLGTALFLDQRWQLPVLITMLIMAVVLGIGQHLMLRRTGLTAVHLAVYAAVALTAAGPLLGLGRGDALFPYAETVAGLALVVTGLVDHRRLVRILGPATGDAGREDDDEH